MDKIKVPYGSNVKMQDVFENVQTKAFNNLTHRTDLLFESYGILNDTNTVSDTVVTTNLKVTLIPSPSYPNRFTVNEGKVIFPNGEYAEVEYIQTRDLDAVALASSTTWNANSIYLIALKWNLVGSDPVTAMAGFRFDPTGVDSYTQKYTTYTDSYKIVCYEITDAPGYLSVLGTDEVGLAIVKTNASAEIEYGTDWTFQSMNSEISVLDVRKLFKLKLRIDIFNDEDVVLTDRSATISGNLDVTGTLTSQGRAVVLEPAIGSGISATIKNFKFDSVSSSKTLQTYSSISPLISDNTFTGGFDGFMNVTLKWNWTSVTGNGGSGTFVVDTNSLTDEYNLFTTGFAANFFADQYLTIPTTGETLYITSSDESNLIGNTTTLYVVDIDGVAWNGTGVAVTSITPARIHANCERYQIVAIPLQGTPLNYKIEEAQYFEVFDSELTTAFSKTMRLRAGVYYTFRIKGVSGQSWTTRQETAWKTLVYESGLTQDTKVLIQHPDISSTGAALSLNTSRNGFTADIAGWGDAEKFELTYRANADPDFTNSEHPKIITSDRHIEVRTVYPTVYHVKVRPLIGSQQVATPLTGTVMSGGDGKLPQDQVLLNFEFDLPVLSGVTGASFELAEGLYDVPFVSGIYTHYASVTLPNYPESVGGKIISDLLGSVENVIAHPIVTSTNVVGPVTNIITQSQSTTTKTPIPDDTMVYTCITKSGRKLWRSEAFPIDYELTYFQIDVYSIQNGPCMIRVYQEGTVGENYADYAVVTTPGTSYVVSSDIKLSSLYGTRTLVVDAWDDGRLEQAVPYNQCSIKGRITVYGRPAPDIRALEAEVARQGYVVPPSWTNQS